MPHAPLYHIFDANPQSSYVVLYYATDIITSWSWVYVDSDPRSNYRYHQHDTHSKYNNHYLSSIIKNTSIMIINTSSMVWTLHDHSNIRWSGRIADLFTHLPTVPWKEIMVKASSCIIDYSDIVCLFTEIALAWMVACIILNLTRGVPCHVWIFSESPIVYSKYVYV